MALEILGGFLIIATLIAVPSHTDSLMKIWLDEGIARVISRKKNGHPVFYQAVQTRRALKTIPLLSFLNTFKNK